MSKLPEHYTGIKKRFKDYHTAISNLGKAVKAAGPLDKKAIQLVQLAASAAIRSEGAVHSHAKRAIKAGATPEEVRHTLIALTSTIGFPTVAAALSWADDVID